MRIGHYGYDDKAALTGERQTVENPETEELLWHHETGHAYSEPRGWQNASRRTVCRRWVADRHGSNYLAGMKLGGTPLLEFTRDRLHRETVRSISTAWRTVMHAN